MSNSRTLEVGRLRNPHLISNLSIAGSPLQTLLRIQQKIMDTQVLCPQAGNP